MLARPLLNFERHNVGIGSMSSKLVITNALMVSADYDQNRTRAVQRMPSSARTSNASRMAPSAPADSRCPDPDEVSAVEPDDD
jgi:hypothetical protein